MAAGSNAKRRMRPSRQRMYWASSTDAQWISLRMKGSDEMMSTIAPEYWIAPALATSGDALEPMQSGSIKALGIQKPWAPPRSYGLLVRIDDEGDFVESLHSRVGGRYHGITSSRDAAQGLVIISKGHGRVLLDTSGVKP